MTRKNFVWTPGGKPPEIEPHSLAKHDVLRAYLERYVQVLTANPVLDSFRLTLIDGFSGGGRFVDPISGADRPGSPLIMLQAMACAETRAQEARTKQFVLDTRFFFIDESRNAHDCLRNEIRQTPFRSWLEDGERIQIWTGEFEQFVPKIISEIQKRGTAGRAIFVLDQCGYSDAPMPTIRRILTELPKAEIILTFATDWLIDYLSTNETTQKTLERSGLGLSSEAIALAKDQHPKEWRKAIQLLLHREIHERSGARYYTPFFIDCPKAHRAYWLIHLSGHSRARDVMAGLHWDKHTHFSHYGRAGLTMLGYDPEQDEAITGSRTFNEFHFDEQAKLLTEASLMAELPARIAISKEGVSFQTFFDQITNDTPATSYILGDVIRRLAREGEIEIRNSTGSLRQRDSKVNKSDILVVLKQLRLFAPRLDGLQ